jgi:hypothetical protein
LIQTGDVAFPGGIPSVVTRVCQKQYPENAALDVSLDLNMFSSPEEAERWDPTEINDAGSLFVTRPSEMYSSAGQVCRAEFREVVSNRREQADVMLCTASVCLSCAAGQRSPTPDLTEDGYFLVFERDLVEMTGHGWAYSPISPQDRPEEAYTLMWRLLEVLFSGGKRFKA